MIDTHVHIFEPQKYDYDADRSYTPGAATLEQLDQLHKSLGVTHRVFVQPSTYGNDNRCLLNSIKNSKLPSKGIAVTDPNNLTDNILSDFVSSGVVGFRFNPIANQSDKGKSLEHSIKLWLEHLKGTELILEIFLNQSDLISLHPIIESAKNSIILDHFSGVVCVQNKKFNDLVSNNDCYIKLSAPYRTTNGENFQHLNGLVSDLAQNKPEKLLWGSDWPHTGGGKERADRAANQIEPFRKINLKNEYVYLAESLSEIKDLVFFSNAFKLYDF